MRLLILGTSSAMPTKERNHPAVLFRYGGEGLLFDCGEGTQRQLRIAKENPQKITKIFITHWHGDHVFGLPGLLESMAMNQGKKELKIYGPVGTKEKVKSLLAIFGSKLKFKFEVMDINPRGVDVILEEDKYVIKAAKMTHSVPCLAYSFEEKPHIKIKVEYIHQFGLSKSPLVEELREGKDITYKGKKLLASKATYSLPGKKFTYAVDTSENPNLVKLASGSDVFICEGTFSNELKNKAGDKGHLTVKQAAKIAKKAKVKELVLTHFSQRYKDASPLLAEAREVFGKVKLARDFMEIGL